MKTNALLLLLASLPATGWAQIPAITTIAPARNAVAAPRNTAVQVGFSEQLSGSVATAGALRVFSQQAGGRKMGTTAASGNTLTFSPSAPFKAGETVQATVTAAAQSSAGVAVQPQVFQFTTATAPATPSFTTGSDVSDGNSPVAVATGDVDGDGNLDLLTANSAPTFSGNGTVSVFLNTGAGIYASKTQFSSPGLRGYANLLTLGDIDGDGDLDLLVSNANSSDGIVDVRRNDGSGDFSSSQPFAINPGAAQVGKLLLGDVDGDGDLDLLAMLPISGTLSLRLNDGNGTFGGGQNLSFGPTETSYAASLGDLDNDGDLDVVATALSEKTIFICFNNGTGTFRFTSQAGTGSLLGDVDNDGDLDLVSTSGVVLNSNGGVQLNNGSGTFAAAQQTDIIGVLLSDIDGDGDLDIINVSAATGSTIASVRLNNGGGTFTTAAPLATARGLAGLSYGEVAGRQFTLGDVDNDGTLDLLVASGATAGVSVRLNQNATSTLRVPENPAGTVAGLTYQYYEAAGPLAKLPDFAALTPKKTGYATTFDPVSLRDRSQAYALRYTGYVTVPTDGQYTFFTTSDDGSQLFIGSQLVVDNDGEHPALERSGTIGLHAGTHAFTLTYFQSGGDEVLNVSYQAPGGTKQPLPAASLSRVPSPTLRTPENPVGTVAGLDYQYYEAPNGSFVRLPDFEGLAPQKTGTAADFAPTGVRERNFAYAIRYTGYLTVPTDGQYTFFTNSDDGSRLLIGSQVVVDNNGEHGLQERSGTIGLNAGTHALTITYFQSGGDEVLQVSYLGPDGIKRPLPAASLSRVTNPTLRTPENPVGTVAGLDYQYYEVAGTLAQLPDFSMLTQHKAGTALGFNVASLRERDYAYALRYTGYVTVPTDGQYTFFTSSDDGSQLLIGSQLVVDNDGTHPLQERLGSIGLQAGTHALTVTYFQNGGLNSLSVSYQGPDGVKQALPAASLRRVPAGASLRALAAGSAALAEPTATTTRWDATPNPFTTTLQVGFVLARDEDYTLTVHDLTGRQVAQLPGGRAQAGTPQQVTWSAATFASGLYLLRLRTASETRQLRVVKL